MMAAAMGKDCDKDCCQGLSTVVKSVVNVQAEALPKRENRSPSWARPKGARRDSNPQPSDP